MRRTTAQDAIYGLDIPLMRLVNIFKSAAKRYGTERRVILLHGPVGSSKSTIARLLKNGLERYSRTAGGGAVHLRLDPRSRPAPTRSCPARCTRSRCTWCPATCARWSSSSSTSDRDRGPTTWSRSRASSARSAARSIRELSERYDGDWTQGHRARRRCAGCCSASRTASASAPSSPRTRRTRTAPS